MRIFCTVDVVPEEIATIDVNDSPDGMWEVEVRSGADRKSARFFTADPDPMRILWRALSAVYAP